MINMQDEHYERKISFLDWGIVFSALLLLLTVYLPQSIWKEEEKLKKEGRQRMSDIANAEEFYFEMMGNYTLDGEHLFELVEAAMDSLIADSLFIGERDIKINNKVYSVNLDKGFETRVDTTFSNPEELYFTYTDTIYTVGLSNPESGGIDTLYVNVRDLEKYRSDKNFKEIFSTDIVERSEIRTDYLRRKYHLSNNFLICPVTNKPYIFEIDSVSEEAVFQVTSPLYIMDKPYKESRFLLFSFEAGSHGYIRGGQKSWSE
tara:strand:- start:2482 stop:3264 length:783 start_codon:yes stop_codon:yes gene_type:complete